jgi:cystathionine beta-lyase/cystathionine gamma-synthase
MSASQIIAKGVPSFESNEALRQAMDDKAQFVNSDLYYRDGSYALGDIEKKLAELSGFAEGEVLAYNSGMSATAAAIDCGLAHAEREKPLLACAGESYSQTKRYIENFVRGQRADVIVFDSGDIDSIKGVLNRRPDVLFTETISNYMNMRVLDVSWLLGALREAPETTAILDNTLPLSTAMPVAEELEEGDQVVVVESGTKSYTLNEELLGLASTKNRDKFDWLQRYRRTRGDLPGNHAQSFIADRLPRSRAEFDERNLRLFRSTGQVAFALAQRAAEVGDDQFIIEHPSLSGHDNAALYAEQYNGGGAPLLYITATQSDQHALFDKLLSNPVVEEHVRRGQSFGFDEARVIYDEFQPAIRISGGAETDGKVLGKACADALYGSN